MSSLWTAVVPLRWGQDCKSRLASHLTVGERRTLVQSMACHVLDMLGQSHQIGDIIVLSPHRPNWWSGDWAKDHGRGLNAELSHWRTGQSVPVCIIHADLPFLSHGDIANLLTKAERLGAAVATDRSGMGSNALALTQDYPIDFQFGRNSRARHAAQLPHGAMAQSPGLATDIDWPEDLALLPDWSKNYRPRAVYAN